MISNIIVLVFIFVIPRLSRLGIRSSHPDLNEKKISLVNKTNNDSATRVCRRNVAAQQNGGGGLNGGDEDEKQGVEQDQCNDRRGDQQDSRPNGETSGEKYVQIVYWCPNQADLAQGGPTRNSCPIMKTNKQ